MAFVSAIALFVAAATYVVTESLRGAAVALCVVYLVIVALGTVLANVLINVGALLAAATARIRVARRRRGLRRDWKAGEARDPGRMLDGPHDAGLLVECLQGLIPSWADLSKTDAGLYELVLGTGERRLEEWYVGELKNLLGRAGESPLTLPALAAFLDSAERAGQGPDFTPRVALAKLIRWEGALRKEDGALMRMEDQLRGVERLWRREDLWALWHLLRSVSPAEIRRREHRRQGLARAQSEFAEALDQRDAALGAVYRQCRDAYLDALEAITCIASTGAFRYERYNPELARRELWGGSRWDRNHALLFDLFRSWESRHSPESWTDPAHEGWVDKWFHGDRWEDKFAYELETGRPAPDF